MADPILNPDLVKANRYLQPVAQLDPLSLRVANVVRQRDEMADELGYLLATILLPRNREYMHPDLVKMAQRVMDRFKADLKPVPDEPSGVTWGDGELALLDARQRMANSTFGGVPAPAVVEPKPFDGTTPATSSAIDFRSKGTNN